MLVDSNIKQALDRVAVTFEKRPLERWYVS
jgi:hypothetical protein